MYCGLQISTEFDESGRLTSILVDRWRSLALLEHRIAVLNRKNIRNFTESSVRCCGRRPQRRLIMHTEYVSYLSRLEHERRDTPSKLLHY